MSGKLSRGWHMAKASGRVLASEPDLVILPILMLAGVAGLIPAIYFGVVEPLGLQGAFIDDGSEGSENGSLGLAHFLLVFLFYLGLSFVLTFFNVALVGAALNRLRGERGGIVRGIATAVRKIWPIMGYAALLAVLTMVLRYLRNRGGIGGAIGAGAISMATGIATFLVAPAIAAEKVNTFSAIRRSVDLMRKTWGESIVGTASIGLVFMLAILALILTAAVAGIAFLTEDGYGPVGIAVLGSIGVAFLCVLAMWMTLTGIYQASVYLYAVDGTVPEVFAHEEIAGAFKPKDASTAPTG